MRAPEFWYSDRLTMRGLVLLPLSWLYGWGGRLRMFLTQPAIVDLPVVCVGNFVAGGAGKTPVALAIADLLKRNGTTVSFLTRGYGGSISDPLLVDTDVHGAHDVGDEALLLAAVAPTLVSANRVAGARMLVEKGDADVILMDDGFQNPSLRKNLSLLVIDHQQGIGNGRLIPAGPLRAKLASQISQADGFIVIGGNLLDHNLKVKLEDSDKPVFAARLEPLPAAPALSTRKIIAFTGIGMPDKFFSTLQQSGAEIIEQIRFPDHYQFTDKDASWLLGLLDDNPKSLLVTTTKDHVRLKGATGIRAQLYQTSLAYPVVLKFAEEASVLEFIQKSLG